jgi:hypothetical protein
MPGEITKKIYLGEGEKGMQIEKALRREAEKHFKSNASKLLLDSFFRTYNLDPKTGKPLKK